MMRLTGALSNHDVGARLDKALDQKRQAPRVERTERPRLRLAMGTIQDTALSVLRDADGSLTPKEVRARVEEQLGTPVSQDTISSFLSVGCRSGTLPVLRTGRGRYRIAQ